MKDLMLGLRNILKYMHFIPFLIGKQNYYYTILIIYIIFVYAIFTIFLIISFQFKSEKNGALWPIYVLKYCLPIFFITFFGQTFLLIISLFECRNGKSYYDNNVSCKNKWLFSLLPFSIIALILQIFISLLTVSMHYKPDYIINNKIDSVLIKSNSLSDICFLFCKIVIILLFVFDQQNQNEHWGIIIFLSLITGFNAYCNLFIQSYLNVIVKRLNNFLSLSLFWSFINLLIQKIFQNFNFDGGVYLFFLGLLLIILFCFCHKENYKEFLNINFNNINSSIDCLKYIKKFLKIIDEKDISRDSLLVFNSYIEKTEEKCTNKRCPLKKYLESLSKGVYSKFLLLRYAEKLYKISISKFPQDIILKINYVIFLYTKINKKKEAKTELLLIKPKFFSFNDNFNLYICEKYLEEYFLLINLKNKEKIETFNIIQALEYKNRFNKFKDLIMKSSDLYYDFWSSLYSCHIQGTEDFYKLNDIGNQINKLIEKIDITFQKLNEIKTNDYEVIKLYESFIKNILNNHEKYKKYHSISINLVNYIKIKNKEFDYTNFDLSILNESDDNNYLLISTDEENKGTIVNISLGACSIFGYTKNEIIGKNMNILIPELFQKLHEKVFNSVTEKTKTQFYDNLVNKIIYKPEYTELYIHAKNKSKYLIPLYFKIYLVQTEESELVYIIEINRNNSYIGELNDYFNHNNETNENICCILTDNNFKIKTFSSNCVDVLKLNSNIINSNYEITSFIKQLNEELNNNLTLTNKEYIDFEISDIINDENAILRLNENGSNKNLNINSIINKSIENKLKNKRKIIKTKYLCPRKITWKIENKDKASVLYSEKIKSKTLSLLLSDNNNTENGNNKYEKNFSMLVKEAYISNKHIGYYFYFKQLRALNNKNKTLKVNRKTKLKKNSLFKNVNIEEILRNTGKLEDEIPKVRNYRTSFSHKNSVQIPDNFMEKKKLSVNFDLDSNSKLLEINDKSIPQSTFNFIIDLKSMSFKPSSIIQPPLELIEQIKNEAINKISYLKESTKGQKNSSLSSKSQTSSSKNEYTSEYSSSSVMYSYEMNSSNIKSDNKKDDMNSSKNYFGSKIINKNNNINEQYYKVNTKNIKFIVYDFTREKFVENTKDDKKSQVEIIMDNYKSNKNINENEDENYPNYLNLNYSKENTSNKNAKADKSTKLLINQNQSHNNMTKYEKEKDFEKEIIDSLAKKDEQKAIIQFYGAVFLCTLVFIAMNLLELFYIISSYTKMKDNMELLINSVDLKYYNNYNIYFLRELLLIFTSYYQKIDPGFVYVNFPLKNESHKHYYSTDIYTFANNSFYQSHSLIESIFSSQLSISKNSSYIINEMPYYSETLIDKKNYRKMNSTLSVSIVYVYSFFCNILTDSLEMNIQNSESFNFIRNAMNSLGKALKILNELYFYELKRRESGIIKNIIFIICINTFIYILIYFINNKSYYKVVNKKMSYLTVFYEIRLPLIKSSIKKCELFISKISKKDMKYERISDIKESSFHSNSLTKLKNTYFLNSEEIRNLKSYQNDDKNKEEKKIEIDLKYKNFQIIFKLILLISFLYLSIILILYIFLTKDFIIFGNYIIHMQNYHNNILELYNGYREFLFDESSIIYGMNSYEFLIYKEKEIYSTNTDDIKFMFDNYKKFENLLNAIANFGFCDLYNNNYFEKKEQCENIIGVQEDFTYLAFDILLSSFVEEIRMKRNIVYKLIKNGNLTGNLSDLIDQELWNNEYLNLTDKTKNFRMKLFNEEEIHNKLNIMFLNVIYPYIEKERDLSFDLIKRIINDDQIKYIALVLCHCFLIMATIVFYWIPKIKNMNVEIYKTKNMLSIIPVQILASLPNIKKLLNISTKDNQFN